MEGTPKNTHSTAEQNSYGSFSPQIGIFHTQRTRRTQLDGIFPPGYSAHLISCPELVL